ncbi:hypothetical protein GUJ93_ZPchr0010g8977 [Zizania palustris]|uniref:Uncharacterized protein n=1 Tax=Zizania palustris TaxID=103762 RepID=A0A8J5SZ87_ZIZPA|nr:hypothetical protein GUJ93_ZPchr0010g8977 [Zizania palustris]
MACAHPQRALLLYAEVHAICRVTNPSAECTDAWLSTSSFHSADTCRSPCVWLMNPVRCTASSAPTRGPRRSTSYGAVLRCPNRRKTKHQLAGGFVEKIKAGQKLDSQQQKHMLAVAKKALWTAVLVLEDEWKEEESQ